jgi:hypothetical protein
MDATLYTSAAVRRRVRFECHIRDLPTLARLRELPAEPTESTGAWVRGCLRSADFRQQLSHTIVRLREAGWRLLRLERIERTDDGVRARLLVARCV